MHKQMMRFDELAIDCASRLAPYKHAKLASIEIKNETTHRYVVRTPEIIERTHDWLNAVSSKGMLIEHQADVNEAYLEKLKEEDGNPN